MPGYYVSENDRKQLLDIDLGERILFLSFMKSISRNHFLFPVDFNRISQALDLGDNEISTALTDRISYGMSEEKLFDSTLFSFLVQAMEKRQQLEIEYSNLTGEGSVRKIEPQYLRNSDGQWYLLAYCHLRNELRVFHVSRIVSWKMLDTAILHDYPVEELVTFFDSSYGVMTGSKTVQTVSILFRNKAVQLVAGKRWHDEQEMKEVPEGVVVSFPVQSYEEVLRVVMSYHSDAEVLEPVEFRELWLEKIREMAEKFL